MESLGDILKRKGFNITSTSRGSTDTSPSAEPEEVEPLCPRCKGAGFVYAEVRPGHPDFGKAVPCSCTQKEFEESRLARLHRYSNLGALTRLTFDNLILRGKSSEPADQERFYRAYQAAIAFAQNPQGWLVLQGPSGCGKTHLAAAIANYRLNQGHLVFFIVVPDLLDHLRSTFSPHSDISYDELFEQVRNTSLLLLDDLGSQSSTPWAQEKLFQIINHRFNSRLPIVITLNIPIEQLEERLRTRIGDTSLSQVYLLQEKKIALFDHWGSLGLESLSHMTFDSFDYKRSNLLPEERQNLEQAYHLARQFAESPQDWLVFQGTNGCGKTHLAAAIANYCLKTGKPACFVVVAEFLDYLRSTFSPESKVTYDEVFERVKTAPLLILDDFGEQASTPWAQEKLYQLINYRYNARLPTVITTCFKLEDIEPRISSRMADFKLSTVFPINAPDYRADRQAARKTKPPLPRSYKR